MYYPPIINVWKYTEYYQPKKLTQAMELRDFFYWAFIM